MKHVKYRVGKWLPSDRDFIKAWVEKKVKQAKESKLELHPLIEDLRETIYADPILYMSFTGMYDEIPQGYNEPVKDFETMLKVMNQILNEAPCFSVIESQIGLVGFPINAILDWAMGTSGGYLAFTHPVVNEKLKAILDEWKSFLASPVSKYVVTEGTVVQPQPDYSNPVGWLSPEALEAIAAMDPFRGQGDDPQDAKANFIYNYKCDPDAPHFGFESWDDFFTREFNPGVRKPDTGPDVIVNACESAPYNVVTNAKPRDKFWMKGQPYSILAIMDNHELAQKFIDYKNGCTVYQAFLCAKSYHKWNSPVDGTIKAIQNISGTYYAEAPIEGYDPAGPNDSQGYIAELAARALIFIESENPKIGLMCFVGIGMAEVSSCDIAVTVGQPIKKGESLGTFHFGGSTHCLIFRPGVDIDFDFHGQTPSLNTTNIPVMAKIGTVK